MTSSDNVARGVGFILLLLLTAACCAPYGTRNSELLSGCAEACGEAGMQSWSPYDGCVCNPEPEICVDVD